MNILIRHPVLSILVSLSSAFFALSPARAGDAFSVDSLVKYDTEASACAFPASVNFAVVKKGSSDFVIWTRDELTLDHLTAIESYARAHDASLKDRNAIFLSGVGSHGVNTLYGTITFEYGDGGLSVRMPRQWSHICYGHYTYETPAPGPEPDPEPSDLTITKTVNGGLWRVRCDYMGVDGQDMYKVLHINDTEWKRDWIKNPGGSTGAEGHRLNKCGDAEHWVIWTDENGVAYRMDEIQSGATGGTLATVVYRTKVEMTDEQIAQIGNPDHPEYVTNYMRNFQSPMPYSEIEVGKRLYWITFNGNQVWYHTGIPYPAEPEFVISVDGVPHVLTGGQSVTIPDLEPGIHEISEKANPLYSLGKVVSSEGGVVQADDGWKVLIQVGEGEDIDVTWPNLQPGPKDPPTPPRPPALDPEPEPEPEPVDEQPTLCELLDFGKRFNAVIFGNLATSGGDTEGALLVWGNATLSTGYTVGLSVVGDPTPAVEDGVDALIVGGNLHIGGQDVNGNVVYGGVHSGTNRAWAGYALRHVEPVTVGRTGNVPADGSGRTAEELLAAVTEVSARVAAWEANGTVSDAPDCSLVLSGTNELRNVFSVTAEQWSGSRRDWIFDVPAGSKIVVNVEGKFVEIENGRMVLPAGVTQADVLVNYVDATFLSFRGFEHEGSVLAPHASASFSNGAIEGIAILGGDVATQAGFEFHNFGLDVFFCPPMPEITVVATAASAADGAIWNAATGSAVDIVVDVRNTSEFWLRSVTLTDTTGATFAVGDLAPGASATVAQTLAADTDGPVAYRATATAAAYDADGAAVVARRTVTASDVALVAFGAAASAGTAFDGTVAADKVGSGAPRECPDYAIEDGGMWFSCIPTFAGEDFTVNVRVKNNGETDADGAFLGLYLVGMDHGVTIAAGEAVEPVRVVEMGRIPAGGSRVYSFSGLTAPEADGVCRVIAYADMDGNQLEWSKGDNQNNLTYELSRVAIHIDVSAEGVTLTWSNGWGQIYSILGSNDLENWDEVITNIPSARDTDGLVENTQFVSFDTGYHFFKLRINQR